MQIAPGLWLKNRIIGWLSADRPAYKTPVCDFERICYEIKPCDVLLIEGSSHISNVIKTVTQSNWSHSVLYIGKLHDFDYSPYFDVIKYPYLDYGDRPLYQKLPWNEDIECNASGDCYRSGRNGKNNYSDTVNTKES